MFHEGNSASKNFKDFGLNIVSDSDGCITMDKFSETANIPT